MPYLKKAIKGAGVTFVMTLLALLIAYATRVVIARVLGPEEYGLFSAVLTFVLFFLFFRNLGLGVSLVKYISEFKVYNKFNQIKSAIIGVLTFQIISSFIFGLAFLLLSGFLAEYYFKDPRAATVLQLFVIYVITSIFFIVLKGVFRGFQKMLMFSSVELVKNMIILLATLLFFKLGYTLYAPVLAYTIVSIILFCIYVIPAVKLSGFLANKAENLKETSKRVILFGIPLFATSFAGKIIGYMDTLILTFFRDLTEVGVYNVVLPSVMAILMVARAITSILFPISAELWAKKDRSKLSEGVKLLHRYSFILFIPIIFTAFSFPDFLLNLFFGEEYLPGVQALQILSIGMLIFIVAIVNNSIISAIGRPKIVAKITLLGAVINIILNMFLIPSLGMEGAAFATSISYAFVLFLSSYKIKLYLRITLPIKEWFKQGVAALIFLVVIALVKDFFVDPWLNVLFSAFSATLVYLISLFLMKALNIKEIKHYARILRK